MLALLQEFWFTCLATFLYFTAFIAMLVDFSGITDPVYQYWYDAMVAAGVSSESCLCTFALVQSLSMRL